MLTLRRKAVKKMVEKKKKGKWEDIARKTTEDFDGGMKPLWLGIKGIIGNRAGKIDNGIATLRAQNGIMVSTKGKREVLVEHYRKLGTPKANAKFDAEFEKKNNAWAEVNVEASKREDSSSKELQRELVHQG